MKYDQSVFDGLVHQGVSKERAMERSAVMSPCRAYRYELWRRWGPGAYAMFIGLNPSTADESLDDPTIRRCVGFAKAWGFDALCMTNLFAFRATDPAEMKKSEYPIGGIDNDSTLWNCAKKAGIVVAAWGAGGGYQGRDEIVRHLLRPHKQLHYLHLTKEGHPGHPLYLPKHLKPLPWTNIGGKKS